MPQKPHDPFYIDPGLQAKLEVTTEGGTYATGRKKGGGDRIYISQDGILITVNPDRVYTAIRAWSRRYVKRRKIELESMFGELSEGVRGMLDNVGQLLHGSRHLQHMTGLETVEPKTKAMFYVQSKSLMDSAKQHELAAVQLAKVEFESRAVKKTAHELIQDGLMDSDEILVPPKRGRGRPRKVSLHREAEKKLDVTRDPLKDLNS